MKKILLVDDEQGILDLMQDFLLSRGYEILTAHNGVEALEKVKEKPNLILLDIQMPVMSGLETLRRLKLDRQTAFIPVIMLTAKGESDSILKTQELGADDFFIKPVELENLLARINKFF